MSGTEIVSLERTDERTVTVQVRLGDDTGSFVVGKRRKGWLVASGDGCGAWPSGRNVTVP